MRTSAFLILALLLPAPALARPGDVLLVDASGGGDFTDLQAAVDAAAEGDTILVRRPADGTAGQPRFGPVVIEGKSLALVSARRGELVVGPIEVRGLGPGQAVVLSGLTVNEISSGLDGRVALSVRDCAGTVRVQDCFLWSWQDAVGRPGVALRDAADVAITRSTVVGGRGDGRLAPGGPGVVAHSARVVVQDSAIHGGAGGDEMAFFEDAFGGPGGTGLEAHASFVHVSGGSVLGGTGGHAFYGDPSEGGDGGIGIDASPDSTVYVLDADVQGGEGGSGTTLAGDPGPAVVGTVTFVAASARGLASPDRVEEGSAIALVLRGEPGEDVTLLRSGAARSRLVDPATGVVQTAPPFERLALGTLPASGELEVALPAPDAPQGGSLELVLQGSFVDPSGAVRLGPAAHVFVKDAEAPPVCGRRFHVDASAPAGGDGSSWGSALRDPNEALVLSADCPEHPTEVWIAEGTYRPEPPGGDRERSFRVWSSTRVHGGFAGHESALDERDIAAHPTVLDGDLNGDDGPAAANRQDNTHHVLRSGSRHLPEQDVLLDGLVVRGGNTAGGLDDDGGGLFARGSASLTRCTFADNRALAGGGVSFEGDRLDVAACRFLRNHAAQSGGGLVAGSPGLGRVRVTDSTFVANHVWFLGLGGAMRIGDCEFELTSSVVTGNYAPLNTAGVLTSPDTDATIANCVLWANRTHPGSGLPPQDEELVVPRGSLAYSCVDGLDGRLGGVGNHRRDPLFVDPLGPDGQVGTLDDDLRLAAGSPCVDAGDNARVPADWLDLDGDGDTSEPLPLDLDGAARFQDDPGAPDVGAGTPPLVDMGALERAP